MRLHKLTYEALMRLLVKKFELSVKLVMTPDLEQLKLDPNEEEVTKVLHNDAFLEWEKQLNAYVNEIKKSGTDLARFWLTYIDLCELLLNLIYATRTGSWNLYLVCIEEVINWAFAYDRQNCARYLVSFLNDMRSLPPQCLKCMPHSVMVNFRSKWENGIALDETKRTRLLKTP